MTIGFEITIDAEVPSRLARFWALALRGYSVRAYDDLEISRLKSLGLDPDSDPSVAIDGDGPTIWFQQVATQARQRNRMHLDLKVAQRIDEAQRLVQLGASIRDEREDHIVMLDPEGNQFCLFNA